LPSELNDSKCNECGSEVVDDLVGAQLVCRDALAWLKGERLFFGNLPVNVRLATVEELSESGPRTIPLGLTRYLVAQRADHVPRRQLKDVVLRRGLSRLLLLSTAVHEFGHVWFIINDASIPKTMEEGFCELLSYRLLLSVGSKRAARMARSMLRSSDIYYGKGFVQCSAVLRATVGRKRATRSSRCPQAADAGSEPLSGLFSHPTGFPREWRLGSATAHSEMHRPKRSQTFSVVSRCNHSGIFLETCRNEELTQTAETKLFAFLAVSVDFPVLDYESVALTIELRALKLFKSATYSPPASDFFCYRHRLL